MNKGEAAVSLTKLTATSIGTAAASSPFLDAFNAYVQLPVWGIPVTVVGAAGFGALLSLFFGDPILDRRSLFGQVLGAAFFGCAVAKLSSDALNWKWAHDNAALAAMVTAAVLRWFLPSFIEKGKQVIRDLKFSFTKKKEGGDQ